MGWRSARVGIWTEAVERVGWFQQSVVARRWNSMPDVMLCRRMPAWVLARVVVAEVMTTNRHTAARITDARVNERKNYRRALSGAAPTSIHVEGEVIGV
jgi:hypothetical protein